MATAGGPTSYLLMTGQNFAGLYIGLNILTRVTRNQVCNNGINGLLVFGLRARSTSLTIQKPLILIT